MPAELFAIVPEYATTHLRTKFLDSSRNIDLVFIVSLSVGFFVGTGLAV